MNMKIEPKTLKGFRDFLPNEARKRQFVISILKEVFESYGFEPLETPVLEYEEILLGKYGDEGDKLMYRFTDNGDRKVAMRYDQTVPLARVAAQYSNDIPLPFKRYQVQNVFRAENTQKGRYREFLQVDCDTIGSDSPLADAELIALAINSYKKLGFKKFKVLINDRKVFDNLIKENLVEQNLLVKVLRAVDKLAKIGEEGVMEEFEKIGVEKNKGKQILDNLKNQSPIDNLAKLFSYLEDLEVSKDYYEFSPTLARGLDYYTGTIFEIVCEEYPAGSLGGGGRYDSLIGLFSNSQIPAVGFAVGFDRTIEAMTELNLFPEIETTKALITVFSKELVSYSLNAATFLRDNNIPCEVYPNKNTSLDKQLKYANKKQIPYVVIIGDDEIKNNKVKIKNMISGEQIEISPDKLPSAIK